MTKFSIYTSDDEPFQYLIAGGHFTKEKALNILRSKSVIEKTDNLEVSDITLGWGRKATEQDRENAMDSELLFLYHEGNLKIPYGYNTKTTFVELIEIEELQKGSV